MPLRFNGYVKLLRAGGIKKASQEIEKLTDSLSPLIFRLTFRAPDAGISTVSTSLIKGPRPVARLHRAVPSAVLDKGF